MSIYPIIPDAQDYVRERTPGTLTRPNAWAVVDALFRGLVELDDQQVEIIRQMDPSVATGGLLDLCGERVFEARSGLSDDEYRLIISGRSVATYARGTFDGVWRTWLAITGADVDEARIMRWGTTTSPVIYLWALYPFVPSTAFLRRAGAVMLDAVAYPFDVRAMLVPADGFYHDGLPGLDSAIVPYSLHTDR